MTGQEGGRARGGGGAGERGGAERREAGLGAEAYVRILAVSGV